MIHHRMVAVSCGAMGTLNPGIPLGKIPVLYYKDTTASSLTDHLELFHQEVMRCLASRICPSLA